MAKSKKTIGVIPSARRLIRSLRDVGYDFRHAVADLIDNSIAQRATTIAIESASTAKTHGSASSTMVSGERQHYTEECGSALSVTLRLTELGKFGPRPEDGVTFPVLANHCCKPDRRLCKAD
jgi:hypothetical protein